MDQPSQSQISLNWNIDTTVGQALTISTNIIRACTSDNIQPLAIMACEKFGAQLAMCPATRLKMERLGPQHHISHVIKIMKLAIGFVPGDAADHLASSDARSKSTLPALRSFLSDRTYYNSEISWACCCPFHHWHQLCSSQDTACSSRPVLA